MEVNFKGLSFVVDHNDYQEFWDHFNNWENKDLGFVIEKAEKDKIFIDIGAWIGPYTLLAAKLGMKVYAFEPDKVAFEVLKKNIQLNEFKHKPKIFNFGLSKKENIAYYSAACFIESFTFPLSKPITLTFTSSPSFTTSVTLATLLSASSEI